MRKSWVFFVIVFALQFNVFGQTTTVTVESQRAMIGDYVAAIPDPEDLTAIVPFAKNRAIAKEIALSKESYDELVELLRESGGAISSTSVSRYMNGQLLSLDELSLVVATKLLDYAERAKKIINPAQSDRLRQVMYQVEIAKVGLGEALIDGFLAKNLEVGEYQKPALRIWADTIEKASIDAQNKIQLDSQVQLISLLTAEQKAVAEKLLGKPFAFREDDFERNYRADDDGIATIPNPDSRLAIASLTCNKSVALELRMSPAEQAKIRKQFKESYGSFEANFNIPKGMRMSKGERAAATSKVQEKNWENVESILDPIQMDRLKEIAYQVELIRAGLASALIDGYLGKSIGINEDQKAALRIRAEEIQTQSDEAILKVVAKAQADMFKQLEPLQRIRAEKLIGKAFLFREDRVERSKRPAD